MKTLAALALTGGLLSTTASAGSGNRNNPNTEFLKANPIYQKSCSKCHGKNAEGRLFGGAPSLISEKIAAVPADELRGAIVNGKGRMPKFGKKLSATDIDAIVEQIKKANTQ